MLRLTLAWRQCVACAPALLGALAIAGLGSTAANAQPAALEQVVKPYTMRAGELRNDTDGEKEIFRQVISGGDVPWIRVSFSRLELAPGSRLLLRSLADDATQTLTATTAAQWSNSSAYFNGADVELRLIAAAGNALNAVEVDRILVGVWSSAERSQCGPTDDRVASSEPERARLLDIGCTASIYNEESCFITAGHCLSSPSFASIVEFNVPLSNGSGSLNHPPPEDQYALTNERTFTNGGVGDDWGLFKVFPNSETGLMPFEAQGAAMTLADSLPGNNDSVHIVGYGVDNGSANQTQQESFGPIASVGGSTVRYVADTEGGNSGSAVTQVGTDEVVAIHTHGGCNVSGSGSNAGTGITHAPLQAALATFCGNGGGDDIGCADVDRMFARCNAAGNIQVLVRMTDASHSGDSVTATVDGNPVNLPLNFLGGQIGFGLVPGSSGTHVVSLSEPAGCSIPDVTVTCP